MVRPSLILAALVAALLLGACGGDDDDAVPESFTVIGSDLEAAPLDNGEKGVSPGDVVAYSYDLRFEDGDADAGTLYGTATTIRVLGDRDVRMTTQTYDLPDGQISIEGVIESPTGESALVREQEFVRPIIGGTGEYRGVEGEVVTVQAPDDEFRHEFRFGD